MENIFFVNTLQFTGAVEKLDIIKAVNMIVESHAGGVTVSSKGPEGDMVSIECSAAEVMQKEIIDIPITKTLKAALKKFNNSNFTNLQLFDGLAALDDNKKVIKSKYTPAYTVKDSAVAPAYETLITGSTKISYEELKRVCDGLKKFVSTDKTRPVLNAIYFNGQEAAAIDGYKLGTVRTYADFKGGLQIHITFIERILKLYKGIQDDITITWRDNNIYVVGEVKGQQVNYKCEWHQAEFIDYSKLWTHDTNYFKIDKKDLLDAVEYVHAAAAGHKNSLMKITAAAKGELVISAANETNTLTETIQAPHVSEEGYMIGLNSQYMQDILKTMFKDNNGVYLHLPARNIDAIQLKDLDGNKCLVLPVRVTSV